MDASPDTGLCAGVRGHCAEVACAAALVRIADTSVTYEPGVAGLGPGVHLLDAPAEERARYVLVMDAINFGSGWFHELEPIGDEHPTTGMSRRLTEEAERRGGVWTPRELRAMDARRMAAVLGQDPRHELMELYAQALRQLGTWLGDGGALDAIAQAGGSGRRLARMLAEGMPFFDDPGYFKRAQIAVNDLVLAGVASFGDVDELTVFADNLLPHVLRLDGVLEYDAGLAARIDAGEPLEHGSRAEREIRAAAVHACELIAEQQGVAPRVLDNWLWNRGAALTGDDPRLPHRTRTVAY